MPRARIVPNTIIPIAKLDAINGDATDIEDCTQVYGDDEFVCLEDNDCVDDGGHVFLNGVCIHCEMAG